MLRLSAAHRWRESLIAAHVWLQTWPCQRSFILNRRISSLGASGLRAGLSPCVHLGPDTMTDTRSADSIGWMAHGVTLEQVRLFQVQLAIQLVVDNWIT